MVDNLSSRPLIKPKKIIEGEGFINLTAGARAPHRKICNIVWKNILTSVGERGKNFGPGAQASGSEGGSCPLRREALQTPRIRMARAKGTVQTITASIHPYPEMHSGTHALRALSTAGTKVLNHRRRAERKGRKRKKEKDNKHRAEKKTKR